jgi:hypothetical protein
MKAVLIRTDGTVEEIANNYDSIRAAVNGWLEAVPLEGGDFVMLCDEEGKVYGREVNERATALADRHRSWEDPLAGDVAIVRRDDEGEWTEFTLADLAGVEA